MYLLLAYLKFVLRLSWSLHRMLRVLQLNLFDRRPLVELFTTPSPPGSPDPSDAAVALKMWDSSDASGTSRIREVPAQPRAAIR